LAGFFLTGATHYTALIPAAFGLLFILTGWLALKPQYLKHAMHAAATLALLGVGGCIRGVMQLPALWSGEPVARPAAVVSQSVMAVICLVFMGLAIASFVQARRQRMAAANS